MAVPKQKKSRSKTRMRRANHIKLARPAASWCSHCGAPKRPHRVCLECGWYNGRQVLPTVE